MPFLHVVTDDDVLARPDLEARARAVLAAGGAHLALHLRGPRTTGRRLFDRAAALLPAAEAAGALLLVNDRVDVAGAAGAHGVHLGRRSLPVPEARALLGPDAWVGASVHGAEEAVDVVAGKRPGPAGGGPAKARGNVASGAGAARPDFLLVGTLYATASHPGRPGAGPDRVREVAGAVARPIPLVGIGGITPGRVPEVRAAGASGIAVLSGVWAAPDPAAAVAAYRAAWAGP